MITKQEQREHLANKIERLRSGKGITKIHLCRKLEISRTSYERRLSGDSEFLFTELITLSDTLSVPVSDLINLDGTEESKDAA